MRLIREVNESTQFIVEKDLSGKGKNYFIEGVFLQSEIQNRNLIRKGLYAKRKLEAGSILKPDDILLVRPEGNQNLKNYWKDLWRYKELFYILSWRDIKVRYKQTVIGVSWSIIRPVLTTIIFNPLKSES